MAAFASGGDFMTAAKASRLGEWQVPDAYRGRAGLALLGFILLLFLLAGVSIALSGVRDEQMAAVKAAPPAPAVQRAVQATSATALQPIAPQDAQAANAALPIPDLPNPAARPFVLAAASAADRARSLDCLTAAIYYEAATEPEEGQRAVAQVVLNRLRHPAYPNTVCGVVFEGAQRTTGCQFSFTCDGSLRRTPMASYWERARRVAWEALNGAVYAPVGWATHYHTNWVFPYWAPTLTKAANIGAHIFYRWQGGWGRPPAFADRYRGAEPAIAWRGGFGQPARGDQPLDQLVNSEEAVTAAERDAAAEQAARLAARHAAADAAVERAIGGGEQTAAPGSFDRAVLRRYEPIRREKANTMLNEQVDRGGNASASDRWALTGNSAGAEQAPLGPRGAEAEAQTSEARAK